LKLKHENPLSTFAFKFSMRRYITGSRLTRFEHVGDRGGGTLQHHTCAQSA
jgi:hypothetical protein